MGTKVSLAINKHLKVLLYSLGKVTTLSLIASTQLVLTANVVIPTTPTPAAMSHLREPSWPLSPDAERRVGRRAPALKSGAALERTAERMEPPIKLAIMP